MELLIITKECEEIMKEKILLIALILIFLIINLYTGFLTFLDYIAEYKTIKIENQDDYIIKEIKEHFDINYDIKKVTFWGGIPDGYYLKIYNNLNQVQTVFEDNHEDSEIYDYFKNVKADIPIHLFYLIIEIIIEIIIVYKIKKKVVINK